MKTQLFSKFISDTSFTVSGCSVVGDKWLKRVIFDIVILENTPPFNFTEIMQEMENCEVPELVVRSDTIEVKTDQTFGYIIDMWLKDNSRRRIRFDHKVNERLNGEQFLITARLYKTFAPYRPKKPRTTTVVTTENTSLHRRESSYYM